MVTSSDRAVLLAGVELVGASVVNLKETATIPKHKTEKQRTISDHVILDPPAFSVSVELFTDEGVTEDGWGTLENLYKAKDLVTLICAMGTYDNLMIRELSVKQDDAKNALHGSITLEGVLIGESEVTEVALTLTSSKDDTTSDSSSTSTKSVTEKPDKVDGSWLKGIASTMGWSDDE